MSAGKVRLIINRTKLMSSKTIQAPVDTLTSIDLRYPVICVGIDVSKDKLDLALLYADRSHSSHVFKNTSAGIKSLIALLQKQGTVETVPCVIESTGNCHLQSAIMITQAGFAVKVINPLITKKYQKSSIRNAKSDPIDARRLAEIGLLEPELLLFRADKSIIGTKKLISYLAHLYKVKQQMSASLKQLKETAKKLGLQVNVRSSVKAIAGIDKQIDSLKKEICAIAPPEAGKMAAAMPGLAEDKIAILLCLLIDKQFASRDQLVAFVGMDIALRKSGKWQGRQKMTKRGEPVARKMLYLIAWGLKSHHPEFKKYYDRLYRQEGKHYTTALMAVARKFLRLLHAYYYKRTVTL